MYDNRKNIAPVVGGAIISAAGSVLGSMLNAKSTNANNQLQQQLVNDANAYNTPGMQMQRFQNAGLNPYMILGQVNAGNQTSVASTSPVDYSSGVQGVGNAANSLIQAASANSQIEVNKATIAKTESETALNQIDAQTRAAENAARINQLVKQGVLTKQQADNLSQDFDLRATTWDELLKQPGLANSFTAEQLANLKAATAKLGSEKKGIDLQNAITDKYGMSQAAASLANSYSQTGVNRAMVAKAFADSRLSDSIAETNRQVRPYQVGFTKSQMYGQRWSNRLASKANYWQPRLWSAQEDAIYNNINLGVANATNGFLNTVLNGVQAVGQYNNFGSLETVHTTNYDSRGNVKSSSKTTRGRRR